MDLPKPVMLNVMGPISFNNIPFEQFSAQLFNSSQSNYTPTHPISSTDTGKGIATPSNDDNLEAIMPLMDQGGSAPDLSIVKKFRIADDPLVTIEEAKLQMEEANRFKIADDPLVTIEEAKLQMEEANRLDDLKTTSEKSEKVLRILNPTQKKAQEKELSEIKAKRENIMNRTRAEYNDFIEKMVDELLITNLSITLTNIIKRQR
ncbi:hypothetical protein Tco_0177978 [Tanacetum coccineum]